jgi:site-specific DNA-methyltransferase (adenine-specific)
MKKRAPRNRTITLNDVERELYGSRLLSLDEPVQVDEILDRTIHQNTLKILDYMPSQFADLIFVDPPYNLSKQFNGRAFAARSLDAYEEWLAGWLPQLARLLTPTGSLYLCGDWRSSAAIHRLAQRHFVVRNRITWEREKGRGAKANWKNASEDIWFCTLSDDYVFNVDAVKLTRRVRAPYTDESGAPKDWQESASDRFRRTHPSNLWTDLAVPFWSMAENTDHPTQKPEKMLAKVILASSNPDDVVFDPFLGSGTTSVVAKKLGRRYVGVEVERDYCCLAEKRLALAAENPTIQGYADGVFWERNTRAGQNSRNRKGRVGNSPLTQLQLFQP